MLELAVAIAAIGFCNNAPSTPLKQALVVVLAKALSNVAANYLFGMGSLVERAALLTRS